LKRVARTAGKNYSQALSPQTGRASLQHRVVAVFQANPIKF
jgi:hypothetical protein